MRITNNSQATQGVHTDKGPVYIKAGQTLDVDLTESGLKFAKRLPFLSIEGSAKAPVAPAADGQQQAPAKTKAPKQPADPELVSARADYKKKFGKGAGPRWTVAQIREKLAAE